ncbi:MAG TPA: MMPL family transporter [Acidimicrobiia bacterium]|nr:MMPL family transporter [Acidimicrobiia bacterium]
MLARLGHFAASHPWRYIATWLGAAALLVAAVLTIGPAFTSSITAPTSESSAGLDLLADEFPGAGGDSASIVFKAEQGANDPEVQAAMTDLFDQVAEIDGVVTVMSPYGPIGAGQVSSTGDAAGKVAYAQLVLDAGTTTDEGARIADEIATLSPDIEGLEVALGGDMFRHREPPSSEMLGLAFAVFVLILSFGSVLAMGLPIATALAGVGTGVAATALLSNLIEMPDFAATIGIMIGLGVGIDYALFIVTRYQQHLRAGEPIPRSVAAALDSAGRAVLFAGVTVVVSLLGMLLMGVSFVTGLAFAAATTVLFTMIASVTLLPALIGLAGQRIQITRWSGLVGSLLVGVALVGIALDLTILRLGAVAAVVVVVAGRFRGPLNRTVRLRSDKPIEETAPYRWSRIVQRRAAIITIAGGLILAIVALPLFSIQLGFADAGNDPEGTTTRRAYDLLGEGFGPGANGPLILVTEIPDGADLMQLQAVSRTLEEVEGVSLVSPPVPNDRAQPTAVRWQITPETSPQDQETADLLHVLREEVVPEIDADLGTGILVTGPVAANVDFSDYLADRIWYFYGAVLLISFLFLMAVFRSVLVPLKAVGMNLLAIGAAYGILVAVFQWGWGGSLLGIEPGPIEPFIPMMLFAIVFGLSMDYEVFLLTRIREEYDRDGDNSQAVADGLAATARVITAAALIMVFVFSSFILEDMRTVKILGLGLAAAVAIDATVIRMLLVPATMELLGDKNWWIPRWMDRLLPNLVVEPSPAGPESIDPSGGEDPERHRILLG